jgi:hypothetical protein
MITPSARLSISPFSTALALVLLVFIGSPAHAQMIPPDQTTTLPGEQGSQQIGGHGQVIGNEAGNLRCRNEGDPIVGMITRKGSVVDYLQLICGRLARIGGRLGWNQFYAGASAGDLKGGQLTRRAMCQGGWAIMGFRAVYTDGNAFLQDFRPICAPIAGVGQIGGSGQHYLATGAGRTDAGWVDIDHPITSSSGHFGYQRDNQVPDDLSIVSRDANKRPNYASSVCVGGAATSIGFAEGQWVTLGGFHTVVQVFQLACLPAVQDTVLAQPTSP